MCFLDLKPFSKQETVWIWKVIEHREFFLPADV